MTKRTRDLAAWMLACCASTPGLYLHSNDLYEHNADTSPTEGAALDLAFAALCSAKQSSSRFVEVYAEAEARVREGWTR